MPEKAQTLVSKLLAHLWEAYTPHNSCCWGFRYFFVPTVLAPILIFLQVRGYLTADKLTISSLIALIPMLYFGYLVYEKFVGPKLRRRGWNEKSRVRGLELFGVLALIFWFLPLLILAIAHKFLGV